MFGQLWHFLGFGDFQICHFVRLFMKVSIYSILFLLIFASIACGWRGAQDVGAFGFPSGDSAEVE